MPRPKRTKLTARNAQQPPQPAPVVSRKPKKSVHIDHTEISDDSDGLVFKSTRARRKRMPWEPEPFTEDVDLTMTGGLPVESDAEQQVSAASRSRSPSAMAVSDQRGASPRTTHANPTETPRSRLRPTSPQARQASAPADDSLGAHNTEEYSENYSFTSIQSKSSPAGQVHPSSVVRKMHATPAVESSMLALAHFKRRPRQGSFLKMVRQTTDVEDNDLDDLGDLSDFGDLDDFHPEAESTPLQLQRPVDQDKEKTRLSTSSSAMSSASRKRKLTSTEGDLTSLENADSFQPDDESTPAQLHLDLEQGKDVNRPRESSSSISSGSKRQKLQSPNVPVQRSPSPFHPPSGSDLRESGSSSPLPGDILESCESPPPIVENVENDLHSETMAPPRSSSPVQAADESSVHVTKPQTRQRRRNKKVNGDEAVDEVTPVGQKKRSTRAQTKAKPTASEMYTAKLASLLPKRKTRSHTTERDEFDIPGSDEENDELIDSDQDELQRPPSRRHPASTKRGPAKSKPKAKPKKKAPPKQKKPEVVPSKTPPPGSRRYGRPSSDKENESTFVYDPEPETTPTAVKRPDPASLAAIAKKFQEVDQWDLEFESVDVAEGESSPWR